MRPSLLRNGSFARFWLGEAATVIGYQMLVVAVAWQMYDLTGSALSLGLIGLVQVTPYFLFVLLAGHVADVWDRRRVALAAQTVQLGVAAVYAIASFAGTLTPLVIYGASFCIGTAQAFQSPALRALLPGLVERERLSQALAWTGASKKAAVIAGPAIGGLVYLLGPAYVYSIAAALFVAAGMLFVSVRARAPQRPREAPRLATMFAGVSYIRRTPVVLGAISLDLFATLIGGATALLPIYARDILDMGPGGLGILRAAPAVGALIASIFLIWLPLTRRVGRTMFSAVAVFGVATIVFGLSRSFPLSLAALMVMGAADMASVVIRVSLVQLDTPDEMRGRVSAVFSLSTSTSNQLGQFQSGVMAALLGTVPAVVVGGVGTLIIVAGWKRLFPALYHRDTLTR
ncbi:MAG: MFS transporter [Burkholderiales bacterium]